MTNTTINSTQSHQLYCSKHHLSILSLICKSKFCIDHCLICIQCSKQQHYGIQHQIQPITQFLTNCHNNLQNKSNSNMQHNVKYQKVSQIQKINKKSIKIYNQLLTKICQQLNLTHPKQKQIQNTNHHIIQKSYLKLIANAYTNFFIIKNQPNPHFNYHQINSQPSQNQSFLSKPTQKALHQIIPIQTRSKIKCKNGESSHGEKENYGINKIENINSNNFQRSREKKSRKERVQYFEDPNLDASDSSERKNICPSKIVKQKKPKVAPFVLAVSNNNMVFNKNSSGPKKPISYLSNSPKSQISPKKSANSSLQCQTNPLLAAEPFIHNKFKRPHINPIYLSNSQIQEWFYQNYSSNSLPYSLILSHKQVDGEIQYLLYSCGRFAWRNETILKFINEHQNIDEYIESKILYQQGSKKENSKQQL